MVSIHVPVPPRPPHPGPVAHATPSVGRTRLRDVPRSALVAFVAWTALAIGVAAAGLLPRALPLTGGLFVIAVLGTIVAWRRSPALRVWAQGLDLRLPILLHVTRIAFGTLFLVELAAGKLPATFAERGGHGDILAGALAIVAALAIGRPRVDGTQPATAIGRTAAWAFSIVGLVDILMVFATAQVMVLGDNDPQLIAAIGHLPYALLPTLVVPLVVLTHLLVIQRLRSASVG